MPPFARNICWIVVFTVSCAGCADRKPNLVNVSGKITFGGKEVPAGRIDFLPSGETNKGEPMGYALIKDGEFDTAEQGRPVASGDYLLRIQGFDGIPQDDDEPDVFGAPLFDTQEQTVTITREQSQLSLDLK